MIDFGMDLLVILVHYGTQVGTMLASFSAQEGRRCEVQPSFLMRWRLSSIFSPS